MFRMLNVECYEVGVNSDGTSLPIFFPAKALQKIIWRLCPNGVQKLPKEDEKVSCDSCWFSCKIRDNVLITWSKH